MLYGNVSSVNQTSHPLNITTVLFTYSIHIQVQPNATEIFFRASPVLWYKNSLLGNDREISKYATAVAKVMVINQQERNEIVWAGRVDGCQFNELVGGRVSLELQS